MTADTVSSRFAETRFAEIRLGFRVRVSANRVSANQDWTADKNDVYCWTSDVVVVRCLSKSVILWGATWLRCPCPGVCISDHSLSRRLAMAIHVRRLSRQFCYICLGVPLPAWVSQPPVSDIPVFRIISVLVCIKFNIYHLSISFYTVIITISVPVSIQFFHHFSFSFTRKLQ